MVQGETSLNRDGKRQSKKTCWIKVLKRSTAKGCKNQTTCTYKENKPGSEKTNLIVNTLGTHE